MGYLQEKSKIFKAIKSRSSRLSLPRGITWNANLETMEAKLNQLNSTNMLDRKSSVYQELKRRASQKNIPIGIIWRSSSIRQIIARLAAVNQSTAGPIPTRRPTRRSAVSLAISKSPIYQEIKRITRALRIPQNIKWSDSIEQMERRLEQLQGSMPDIININDIVEHLTSPTTMWNRLTSVMGNINYFITFLSGGVPARINAIPLINLDLGKKDRKSLWFILDKIANSPTEYDIEGELTIQLLPEVTVNPPISGQRDGIYNCVCLPIKEHLQQIDTVVNTRKIDHVNRINAEYLKDGINDTGIQELSDKTKFHLIFKDHSNNVWREFQPVKGRIVKTLVYEAHNNHSQLVESDPYDSDDEDEIHEVVNIDNAIFDNPMPKPDDQEVIWFDTKAETLVAVEELEREGITGKHITSKGALTAYITDDIIYKTKFHQWEDYPKAFTAGGVGKIKFDEQLLHTQTVVKDTDPFHQLTMDADVSGFYMRSEKSNKDHFKYDQNHSYKSFETSGIFKGFPKLEAVFNVDKKFSQLKKQITKKGKMAHGLLYIEAETLNTKTMNNHIYYETSGWYPIEIVNQYFKKHKINPVVLKYAYASETFDIDFSDFTNEQFRSFIGKCISRSFDEVWRTTDRNEYLRARYQLRERIIKCTESHGIFEITYTSDESPWNYPIISAYVKAHQKYNLFQQYNKLIDNGILPVCISVDGIEVKEQCDNLFKLSDKKTLGTWKLETVRIQKGSNPMVIERVIHPPRFENVLQYNSKYLLSKRLHISGAGGNGKTEFIVNLSKSYLKLCYIAPTGTAVSALERRAKTLGIDIVAKTYHKAFGILCKDNFNRDKYTHFICDEISMVSLKHFKLILDTIADEQDQSLILSGDFAQLENVEGAPIFHWRSKRKSIEYEAFTIRELKKNWRQKADKDFFNLCNRLREKIPAPEAIQIINKLNTRFLKEDIDFSSLDDQIICGTNSQVNAVNLAFMAPEHMVARHKVICNKNITDQQGNKIKNGFIGMFDRTSGKNIITWRNGMISTFKTVSAPQFTPAYAVTVHKAQGDTITGNLLIDPSRLFADNHLYVALTRATCFDCVYLAKKISLSVFKKTVYVR